MLSFVELREKVKLAGGERQIKSFKAGKKKDKEVVLAKKGTKFSVYVDGELLDNNYKNQKEAEKAGLEFVKVVKK